MELDEAINSRQSIHSFKSKKVSWKEVLEAVHAALQGPAAGNKNHLSFLIVEDSNRINKLAEYANQSWICDAGIVIVVCSDDSDLEKIYGTRGRVYSRQQAGAAIQNFLLKITDMGLAACWVGSYSDELIKQSLDIPSHIQIEALIPVGYESGKSVKKKKKSLENSIFWENWDNRKRPTLIEEGPEKIE